MPVPADYGTDETYVPPALLQGSQYLTGAKEQSNMALQKALALRRFKRVDVPGIVNQKAASGDFFSGGTTKQVNNAAQDLLETLNGGSYGVTNDMAQILQNQFLISLGLRLPGGF